MKSYKEKLEEILINRIVYIGNEIPDVLTTDKRDKSVYLGCPADLIKELECLIDETEKQAYERGAK